MRILLVYPEFPLTYWGFQYGLPLAGKRANLPPLGLATVAALLPADWPMRLVDLNVEPLTDADLRWADVVLTGGMRVQIPSTKGILQRARAVGKRTVVGGPALSTDPALFPDADVRISGEVEGMVERLIELITSDERTSVVAPPFPAITQSPVPRFDLLKLGAYGAIGIQYSRGCPFNCEFCDIIGLFGRTPRVKSAAQVIAEFEALLALGHRDAVFVVDDNFIGNQKAASELLPQLTAWQQARGYPFNLATEASVNLAARPKLLDAMVAAGFSQVFLGIETPSIEALSAANKGQNLRMSATEAIDRISRVGIEVMGGFIVGFDSDTHAIFDAQRALILDSPVPLAMVGLLMALPKTALFDRLEKEGRLRATGSGDEGDQFGRANFDPAMDELVLLEGYAALLASVYTADAYYARVDAFLEQSVPLPGGGRKVHLDDLATLARVVWGIGIKSPRRRHFWRLLGRTATRRREKIAWMMARVIVGEHMIRYTEEDVLPRLAAARRDVVAERFALGSVA